MNGRLSARAGAALLCLGMLVSPAFAAGDAEKGKKVFNKCKACHFVDQEKNKAGPHLVGVMGRAAGSIEGYKYSKAMLESGVTWSEETIAEYVAKPKDFIPGNKMVFSGIKKEDQIADLLAYLSEATKKTD